MTGFANGWADHDKGLTGCSNCGTVDSQAIGKAIADAVREELAKHAPDATVARSPLAEGDGSGGEGCEAQGRSEGVTSFNRGKARRRLDNRIAERDEARALAADWRCLAEKYSAERDDWHREAIAVTRDRDYLRKFLDETVRERDEARTALAVARAQAESEAVARAEAEAERDALPGKIAAKISEQRSSWISATFSATVEASAAIARSFIPAEPVPEPVREWGVRHGDDCIWNHGSNDQRTARHESRDAAKDALPYQTCTNPRLVSRVPGGEWEAAE